MIAATCAPGEFCSDVPANIAFGLIAAVMVFCAIRVVTTRNVIHAALYLVGVLAGVGAQYLVLQAEFLAMTQFLVYVGAIVVLLLFGVMLTKAKLGVSDDLDNDQGPIAAIVALITTIVIAGSVVATFSDDTLAFRTGSGVGNTESVSDSVFSTYLIPFEVVSVLLLAALIGAIVVARKD